MLAAGGMKFDDCTGASGVADVGGIGLEGCAAVRLSKVAEGIMPSSCPERFGGKEADWYEVGG